MPRGRGARDVARFAGCGDKVWKGHRSASFPAVSRITVARTAAARTEAVRIAVTNAAIVPAATSIAAVIA